MPTVAETYIPAWPVRENTTISWLSLHHVADVSPKPAFPTRYTARPWKHIAHYCQTIKSLSSTEMHHAFQLPAKTVPSLSKDDVFFGVMTAASMIGKPYRHANATVRLQGGRVHTFADYEAVDVTPLSASMALENEDRSRPRGVWGLGQHILEIAFLMDERRFGPARWWCILDDDILLWVDRMVDMLGRLDDAKPIIVGGTGGQMGMCNFPLGCNETTYKALHDGDRPVVQGNGGGGPLCISRAGNAAIRESLRRNRCIDGFPDMALASCAIISGLKQLTFAGSGAFIPNNPRAAFGFPVGHHGKQPIGFRGRIVSYHKVDTPQALCIARKIGRREALHTLDRHPAECDPDCVPQVQNTSML
jgi:hypothetical protein